ncbi:hypothetical protein [Rhizobium sp. BK060]|uniref:hypothetical protein n=1 Tax=Rhizobium sp. BK060 TaxID=2587096 RepID=UPI001621B714|nr:hypothetical protein [Rhizobium sp. BK060]MBB3393788.1 DNA-binding transcriptional ArsR family regulator [Rhizobium sp. BK060]
MRHKMKRQRTLEANPSRTTGNSAVDDHAASPPENAQDVKDALKVLERQGVLTALRGAKEGIEDLLQNTDQALSVKLAVVYGAGLIVEEDDDEWNALCGATEWVKHPKVKPNRADALRAVLRLAVGFDGRKADSTVHRYYGPGRDDGYPSPPGQIRTCGTTAYGSYRML